MSRTSGNLPAFVQVSASAILASGSVPAGSLRPYEDLEFSWNFGDPSGTEIFYNPVTQGYENANTQVGPEASYCYRTAGTKTITLTIRGKNVLGGYTTASVQGTFTASTVGWTDFYFDSNAVSDGDGSIGNPWKNTNHILFNTGVSAGGGIKLHIKRGSVINCTGTQVFYVYFGQLRVDAYGSGADPIINGSGLTPIHSSTFQGVVFMTDSDGQGTVGDVVFSNMDFRRTDGNNDCISIITAGSEPTNCHDIYFDNCSFTYGIYIFGSTSVTITNDSLRRNGIWGGTVHYRGNVYADILHGTLCSWWFCCGVNWVCDDLPITQPFTTTEHTIYVTVFYHSCWKWNNFGQPTALQNHQKMSTNSSQFNSQYHYIGDCFYTYTDGIAPGRSNEASGYLNYLSFVMERNLFLNYHNVAIDVEDPQDWTIRYNYFSKNNSNNEAVSTRPACFIETNLRVYYNNFYGPFRGMVFTDFGWQLANQVNYNIFWNTAGSAGSASQCIALNQADQVAAGTVIDFNQYYSSVTNQLFSVDGATSNVTFTAWKNTYGWDANGTLLGTPPSWPNPAIGNFGQFV